MALIAADSELYEYVDSNHSLQVVSNLGEARGRLEGIFLLNEQVESIWQ